MKSSPEAVGSRSRPSTTTCLLVIGALVLAITWVFRGALSGYFAQEDFRGIAVAKGILPRHASPWRWVSVQLFMDLCYPIFGNRPRPYHLVSLGLHAANASLLFWLLSRRARAPAAALATFFFAVHPALFTALYWMSARADILATTFALATLGLALRHDAWRWLAAPVFALSLLSKESTLFLPAVVAAISYWESSLLPAQPRSSRAEVLRDPLLVALLAVSAVWILFVWVGGRATIGIGTDPSAPYAIDLGWSIGRNLLTYVGWTADLLFRPSPLRFVDRQNPQLFGLAAGTIACWALAGALRPLRRRGWLVAGVSFVLLLLPVLPLRNHTYRYFLYAPLAAASWCLCALADGAMSMASPAPRRAPTGRRSKERATRVGAPSTLVAGRLRWIFVMLCSAALTLHAARWVEYIERRPMLVYPQLRGDPIVDRARVAERVIDQLRHAELPDRACLVFLLRERLALLARIASGSREPPPPPDEVYPETNLRNALFEGIGVRALDPRVVTVAFGREPGGPTERLRYVVYAPTGDLLVLTPDGLDSLVRSPWIDQW
jgi:hypothetical protein